MNLRGKNINRMDETLNDNLKEGRRKPTITTNILKWDVLESALLPFFDGESPIAGCFMMERTRMKWMISVYPHFRSIFGMIPQWKPHPLL